MTDPTTAAARIRAAIQRCIDASPAPPTTDDIAAAVLQEAAAMLFPEEPEPERPEQLPMDIDTRHAWIRYCSEWNCWRTRERGSECLQALARELNGTDPIRGVPPLLAARDALAAVPPDGPAVPEGREPAAVVGEPNDEDIDAWITECADATRYGPLQHYWAFDVEFDDVRDIARAVLARFGHHSPDATKMVGPGPSIEAVGSLIAWLSEQACQAADAGQPTDAGMLTWAAQVIGERVDEDAPAPPAEGEVAELVAWLRRHASAQEAAGTHWADQFTRAADLLEAQAALAQQLNDTDYGDASDA